MYFVKFYDIFCDDRRTEDFIRMFEKNLSLALNDEMKVLRREAIGRVSLQTNAFEFEMIKMAKNCAS